MCSFLPRLSSRLCHVLLLHWWVLKQDAEFSGANVRSMSPDVDGGRSVRAVPPSVCGGSRVQLQQVLRHAVVHTRCSSDMRNSPKVCQSGSNCAPLMGTGKAFILGRGAFVCLGFLWFLPAYAASCISLKVNLFYHRTPKSNHCSHLIEQTHAPNISLHAGDLWFMGS